MICNKVLQCTRPPQLHSISPENQKPDKFIQSDDVGTTGTELADAKIRTVIASSKQTMNDHLLHVIKLADRVCTNKSRLNELTTLAGEILTSPIRSRRICWEQVPLAVSFSRASENIKIWNEI